jgi:hypothetical protein
VYSFPRISVSLCLHAFVSPCLCIFMPVCLHALISLYLRFFVSVWYTSFSVFKVRLRPRCGCFQDAAVWYVQESKMRLCGASKILLRLRGCVQGAITSMIRPRYSYFQGAVAFQPRFSSNCDCFRDLVVWLHPRCGCLEYLFVWLRPSYAVWCVHNAAALCAKDTVIWCVHDAVV